jgi:hypothetical protein
MTQGKTELLAARDSYSRAHALRARQAISQQEYAEAETRYRVGQA